MEKKAAAAEGGASNNSATPTPNSAEKPPRRRGVKRKSIFSTPTPSKRRGGKTSTPLPHFYQNNHNGPITRARQSPNKLAAASAAASSAANSSLSSSSAAFNAADVITTSSDVNNQNKSNEMLLILQPQIGDVSVGCEGMKLLGGDEDGKEENNKKKGVMIPGIEDEFEVIRSRDSNVHVVPTPAAWFSWTKIHGIEERGLPSFFSGKSEKRTPDVYMEIRNAIMRKYHNDPKTQIESKDLSELTVGELDARQVVMEFLDHWGLINFHPFPVVDSEKAGTKTDGSTKTASLADKLYKFEEAISCSDVGHKPDLSTQAMPPQLFPESAIPDEVRPEGPAVEYHCNSCSADCSRKRYHCQKQADFDLCSECYNNGKFDSGMSPTDFILMEPAEAPGVSCGSWTDQETLLLLEALELFGENWSEIAEHVATKSKAQCILHFVQMPIEDVFLEGKDDYDASLQVNNVPGSTNDDSSALIESNETLESKSTTDTDLPAVEASHAIMDNNSGNNGSSTLSLSPKTMESKNEATERPLSPKLDDSDPREPAEVKISEDISANCAINALKEAFDVVGSGDSISFADAGNPVMALAAFLSGLVEPDIAATWACGSLKVTSEDSPGIQLAARHCFVLEDPPNNLKKPPASESADVEMVDGEAKQDGKAPKDECFIENPQVQKNVSVEAQSDKDQNPPASESADVEMVDGEVKQDEGKALKDESQKEHHQVQNNVPVEAQNNKGQKEDGLQLHNHVAVIDGIDPSKDYTDKKIEDAVLKETVPLSSSLDEGKENSAAKERDYVTNKEDVAPGTAKGSNDSELLEKDCCYPKDEGKENCATKKQDDGTRNDVSPSIMKDPHSPQDESKENCTAKEQEDVTTMDVAPGIVKESAHSGLPGEDQTNSLSESGKTVFPSEAAPSSVEESTDVTPSGEISQSSEVPKDVDMVSASIPSEDKDPQETVAPTLAIESGADPGQCVSKVVECEIEKNRNTTETRDDDNVEPLKNRDQHSVDKVKRAALTVLSAAAMKAKLLADQEEHHIRQLATYLIEKQLHKIETKLAFFHDMDHVTMRAKEQMDRSRQRLYNERAQIIAARLGLPATSSRAMPPSIPSNRVALSYANSVPKSLPNMNSQKAPVNTFPKASPSPSFSSVSNAARGGSAHPSC
ncbi:hypothetical protein IFM89_011047 [Coptis chinensis]|uniref:SWI/SNF complex subunit SWI3D n=1 Tax=Coptis chinensis TaxID=261450 RepID=A0A835IQ71_9MAGN|nr:hypothetical protein IFM89_011047 [Coptis chinensis]